MERPILAWAAEGASPAPDSDQDELTLAIAAIEQLEHRLGSLRPEAVRVATDLPPARFELLPFALATPPAEFAVFGPGTAVESWRTPSATGASLTTLWVIVPPSVRGDRVVALLRSPSPTVEGSSPRGDLSDPTAPWTELLSLVGEEGGPAPASWAAGSPTAGTESSAPVDEVDLGQLSEGAYVPRARYVENLPSRWRFAAERCSDCGTVNFPPRGFCRQCGRTGHLAAIELPRRGLRVTAVTTIHPGAQPSEFDWRVERTGAYDVALVEWAGGGRVTLQVADLPAGRLRPGDRVDTLVRRLYPMEGEWRYGRKVVPGAEATPSALPSR